MQPEDVARAVALYDDGRSVCYIANVMNMARSTTHDAIKRYRETLEYTRRPGSGRPRATNPNEDRYMVLRVLMERNLPATSVAQQFVNMHGRPISAKTVRRRLKASGLISSRPATGPRLLRMHRVKRLRFANDHRDWRNGQWSCVLFTDESRFNLCSSDGRERVWRRRGERFSQCCISENVPYGAKIIPTNSYVLQASSNVRDLNHVTSVLKGEDGEKGYNKDCHGKSADHTIIQVPVGTIIRSSSGKVVGDLKVEGTMFVAARGGAGGRGNHFFVSPTEQAPKIAEYGADGEELQYVVEVRSMAHVGLIGFPNAGKSTLLQAISRARPKIAPYPFTTLKPHLGMIQYDDYEQVAVADLPGLMPGSHKNRGLGIAFLKHAERCASLLYLLDLSSSEPWTHLETLQYELSQFNSELLERPQVVVANKLDLPEAKKNLPLLKEHVNLPIVAISAKMGTNLEELLHIIKEMYEKYVKKSEDDETDML
ncbi:hypothetical protein ANN_23946 [Periplaneta americana]|uniref:Mitochondrial ribosome-associated GTPase 2 n=1 Tax=Periplaneta americana TaxID=6978 RepID=A0ABQ8S207_PERAM|nr:hypothetical protein ANN_23946 [Periplaneta americana]